MGDHATKSEKGNWEASVRAVRAEAEAALTRGFALTLAATLDGAQAELKAYRDAVDAQPWATDEPIRVMLDRVTMLWAPEKQAKVERGDMLCECQAELATERARLKEMAAELAHCAGYIASVRTDRQITWHEELYALQTVEWAEGAVEIAEKANAVLEAHDAAMKEDRT